MDHTQTITEIAQSFLAQMNFPFPAEVEVTPGSEAGQYHITYETEHPAQLIGYHGEVIAALQMFISIHAQKQLGEKIKVLLNVNDYRERRQSSVESIAEATVQKVIASNQAHALPPMTPAERRLVHVYISEKHPNIVTHSEGEGRDRSVILSLKA